MGTETDGPASGSGLVLAERYRLESPLGTGGMAQVWAAEDLLLARPVAVKLLHRHLAEDPAFVQRFRREAVAAARLVHPNIVAVYDTVSDDHHEAIVMELVRGTTLREHLDRHGPLPAAEVRRIGTQLAGALDCAHRNGIVHRDIKPANVLVTDEGAIRLTDFGIAKAEEDPDLTVAGTLVGTAAYLAPEQVGGGRVDQRTDLYSASIVLYEALSGATPFRGDSPAATALARLHQEPVDLADVVGGEADLTAAIMRNLRVEPEGRFQSALDFGAAIAAAAPGRRPSRRQAVAAVRATPSTTSTTPADPATRPAAAVRRGPRRSWVGRGVLGVLIGGPVVLVVALLATGGGDSSPSTTSAPAAAVVPIGSASSLDPFGDNGEENGADAPLAIDGDATTSWSTESYDAQTFGTKPGVGLVLDLAETTDVTAVRLVASVGWRGRLHVLSVDPAGSTDEPAGPSTPVNATTSPLDVRVDGAAGRWLVVWITDLGPSAGRHRVTISDVTVTGRRP